MSWRSPGVRRGLVVLGLLFVLPPSARGQSKVQAAADTIAQRVVGTDAREHVVFSISGGISLGSYQAGVNWMLLQAFQQAERVADYPVRPVRVATVTGASAGNINTLFWAAEWCRDVPASGALPGPEATLFWNLWVERADLHDLLPARLEPGAELGLLNRAALVDSLMPELRARFDGTRAGECALPIGLTITSVEPATLWMPNADRFPIQTQRFAAFFEASNDLVDGDRALRFHALPLKQPEVGPRFGMVYPMHVEGGAITLEHVLNVVKASSSFPVAFSPVALPYAGGTRLFMDGGVFDNNPVSLALLLYDNRADARPRPTLVYVNPGRMREARPDTARDAPPPAARATRVIAGGLSPAWDMAGGAIGSARQYELQLLARDKEVLQRRPRWAFSDRRAPLVGEHLGAFAAFIAHPFREYDFYVGVYDGLLTLAREFSNCRPDAEACLKARVETLRADPELSLPVAALPLLDVLHDEEFGDALALERRCATSDWSDLTPEQRIPIAIACALEQRIEEPHCTPTDLASWVACADGLQPVLASLSAQRETFELCAAECLDAERREGAERFSGWIDDPASAGAALVDRVLGRVIEIERRAGARYAGESTGFEAPLEATAALYYGSGLRRGHHTTSLPPAASPWWHLVPNSVTGGVRESALDVRWERMVWRWIDASLVYHYNEDPRADAAGYPNLGVALGVSTQWPWDRLGYARFAVNRWGAQGELFAGHLGDALDGDADPFGAVYVFTDVLLGKLRLAYRYVPDEGLLHGPDNHGFMIGVSDVVGLAYWTTQLLRGPGAVR